MKVIPAQAGSWLSLVQKSHSAKGGREPYFPKAAQGGDLSLLHGNVTRIRIKGWGSDVMYGWAEAQSKNQWDPRHPLGLWCQRADCDVFLTLRLGCFCAQSCCEMEKISLKRDSDSQLPECATPICQRKSPAASVGAGYQRTGTKSLASYCVSVRLVSVGFIPFHRRAKAHS